MTHRMELTREKSGGHGLKADPAPGGCLSKATTEVALGTNLLGGDVVSQFCASCGKPIAEGAGFCTACGARQSGGSPAPNPGPATPAKGSSVLKIVVIVAGIFALITVIGLGSCIFIAYRFRHKAEQYTRAIREAAPATTAGYHSASGIPYLPDAMTKMGDVIVKPISSFHLSFKKADSDGTSYILEEDVTPSSMTGQETQVLPKTQTGPGGTRVFPRNATAGTHEWQMTANAIQMAYLNPMDIRDAQDSVKYVAEQQVGGYDARRYDFDLSQLPASERAGTVIAGKWLGGVVNGATGGGQAVMKDYNVKGSVWLAKDDGRMVKFSYDYITIYTDGSQKSSHHEGLVTRK
jgi:zinc-ribbon domain